MCIPQYERDGTVITLSSQYVLNGKFGQVEKRLGIEKEKNGNTGGDDQGDHAPEGCLVHFIFKHHLLGAAEKGVVKHREKIGCI